MSGFSIRRIAHHDFCRLSVLHFKCHVLGIAVAARCCQLRQNIAACCQLIRQCLHFVSGRKGIYCLAGLRILDDHLRTRKLLVGSCIQQPEHYDGISQLILNRRSRLLTAYDGKCLICQIRIRDPIEEIRICICDLCPVRIRLCQIEGLGRFRHLHLRTLCQSRSPAHRKRQRCAQDLLCPVCILIEHCIERIRSCIRCTLHILYLDRHGDIGLIAVVSVRIRRIVNIQNCLLIFRSLCSNGII